MKPDDPAFPALDCVDDQTQGMSLRAYLAAKAMQGYRANPDGGITTPSDFIARASVCDADALLAELNK